MRNQLRSDAANRITWISVFWEIILVALKFMAGIVGHSSAIIADAFHSISDLASDIVVLISFRIVKKPVDENHHYGHGKFETLSTIMISVMIILAATGIFWSAFDKLILAVRGGILPPPGWVAAGAALVSIFIKEMLYRLTLRVGQRIKSPAISANAWHHRSDSLSSIAALVGISGAILLGDSWRILDPIAAILVGFIITKIAIELAKESIDELLEASLADDLNNKILTIVKMIPGASNPHNLKTRKIGNAKAIDLHIRVKPTLSIVEAHDIATNVEDALRNEFGQETFISVHIEPLL